MLCYTFVPSCTRNPLFIVFVELLQVEGHGLCTLKQSSISFFNSEETETAVSRWARSRTRAAKIGKGLCKDEKAQILAPQYWLEAIDPLHRCGDNLQLYREMWLDVGEGKDINLENCPRIDLQRQCIKYLGPSERGTYEVIVQNGKLMHRQTGILVNTIEGSECIFVLSTSRDLYVGQKKEGVFQHSSFLSGGAAMAAGRLVAHNGVLEAMWPDNDHYLPTVDNFKEFISFLEDHQVDLTNVKMRAIDDRYDSISPTDHQHESVGPDATNGEVPPVLDLPKHLSPFGGGILY
ncbi:hypothetical protein COP2_044124 [Malus domestica]